MGICKHCGAATTLEGTVHGTCQQLHADGYSDDTIGRIARGEAVAATRHPKPVTFGTIVGGVFVGLWLFFLSASIVWGLFRLIGEVTAPFPPQ
jgi:hypothetical protein